MFKRSISGLWKTVEIHTGHVSLQCLETEAFAQPMLRSTNHKTGDSSELEVMSHKSLNRRPVSKKLDLKCNLIIFFRPRHNYIFCWHGHTKSNLAVLTTEDFQKAMLSSYLPSSTDGSDLQQNEWIIIPGIGGCNVWNNCLVFVDLQLGGLELKDFGKEVCATSRKSVWFRGASLTPHCQSYNHLARTVQQSYQWFAVTSVVMDKFIH